VSVKLYTDAHVRRAVVDGLRLRQVDVLTALDDGASELPDDEVLNRAQALGRVLFTQDVDMLVEADRRQQSGETFAGIIFAHQMRVTTGECVADLELIAKAYEPEDMMNRVEFLPLR
jgi:predicted nuclease of predicted toxin-antitoxin system